MFSFFMGGYQTSFFANLAKPISPAAVRRQCWRLVVQVRVNARGHQVAVHVGIQLMPNSRGQCGRGSGHWLARDRQVAPRTQPGDQFVLQRPVLRKHRHPCLARLFAFIFKETRYTCRPAAFPPRHLQNMVPVVAKQLPHLGPKVLVVPTWLLASFHNVLCCNRYQSTPASVQADAPPHVPTQTLPTSHLHR